MSRASCALVAATSAFFVISPIHPAFSQSEPAEAPPSRTGRELEITITANRTPTAIQRTGSAITVVSSEEIRKTNPGSLVDALRYVPGLDISETGGPGGSSSIRLRGANAGQTLVLVDGIRVNDASGASGEFDIGSIPSGLIDRIEVLRGPQSALYGSDAMGGVINIITRRGRGPLQGFAQVEGGSYGTLAGNAGVYGTKGPWSYSFAASGLHRDGFSRYGYRVPRLRARGPFENDSTEAIGGFGRLGYNPGTGFRFEVGAMSNVTRTEYDAAFGAFPDTPSASTRRFHSVWARAEADSFDNRLTSALTLSANRTDRFYRDTGFTLASFPNPSSWTHSDFTGDRFAAEYQGTIRLDRFGTLVLGAKTERETALTFDQGLIPVLTPRVKTLDRQQDTHSLYSLWQLPIGERLDVSFGGRLDHVPDVDTFLTWRTTAAYRILETGTKLRTSIGTGGKAPTLFQRYAPIYGTASLRPEHSFGGDLGIDQSLLDGRIKLSATLFYNKFQDLISFATIPGCPAGCYQNVARAETSGLELEGSAVLWADYVTLKGAYTFLRAKDLATGRTLARRPESVGKLGLAVTPIENLTIEPSMTLVSKRFSGNNQTQPLKPYARFDMHVNYKINQSYDVYVRGENLNNARYQEVANYGTTGRAVYAGMKATW